jgi:hypothetical protein
VPPNQGGKCGGSCSWTSSTIEWVYVVPPGRVGDLVGALGGGGDDDVLDLLAGYYERNHGGVGMLLRSREVAAEFANWHS